MKNILPTLLLFSSSLFSQNLVLDHTFNQGNGFGYPVNTNSLLELPNNKTLVAINQILSPYYSFPDTKLFVVNEDGTYDSSFSCGTGFGARFVYHSLMFDQSIIIAGTFLTYNDVEKKLIAKIDFDGNLDESFNTDLFGDIDEAFTYIHQISLDNAELIEESKIYICGTADSYRFFLRLNHNGSLDESFNVDPNLYGETINRFAVLPDGQILVFSFSEGLYKLNIDGFIDAEFDFNSNSIVFRDIRSIIPLDNGKVLLGGNFVFNNEQYTIIRLNADGSLDESFLKYNFGFPDTIPFVYSMKKVEDRIVAVGNFDSYMSSGNDDLVVLYSEGSLDNNFSFGGVSDYAGGDVGYIAQVLPLSVNKIVIAGNFHKVDGELKNSLARLTLDNLNTNDYDKSNDITVYSQNQATYFNSANHSISSIELYDISGKLIDSAIVNSDVYSCTLPNNSLILYRIFLNDGNIVTGKVIR